MDGLRRRESGIARATGISNDFSCSKLACPAETAPTTVAAMKISMKLITLCSGVLLIAALATLAATPEQEKALTDKYKAIYTVRAQGSRILPSFSATKFSELLDDSVARNRARESDARTRAQSQSLRESRLAPSDFARSALGVRGVLASLYCQRLLSLKISERFIFMLVPL